MSRLSENGESDKLKSGLSPKQVFQTFDMLTFILDALQNSDGVVSDTKSKSDDEKLNLTPCFPPEKWYSLTIGLDVPKKEKEGAVAVLIHIFDWVSDLRPFSRRSLG